MESQFHPPRTPSLLSLLGLGDAVGMAPMGAAAHVRTRDELYAIWSAARAEANLAYDAWRGSPDREAYLIYRAAEDRADAAQDALSGITPAELPLAA